MMKILLLMALVLVENSGCVPHATGPPFSQLEGPETGKVVVYLYLANRTSVAHRIFADDLLITKLMPYSYYRYVTVPGQITFSLATTRPQDRVIVRALPGSTYFIEHRHIEIPTLLGAGADYDLVPRDQESALPALQGLRLIVPSDWQ